MFSADRYDRVAHALGKAYRDVVRGFRGEFPNPPDLVAYPESPEDVDAVLDWCADEGAAAIPYRRRHQRGRRRRAADARGVSRPWSPSTCGGWTGCSRWTRSRRRRGSRRARPGPGSRSSCASTASRCATSRSPSSTRPWAAGSRPAPAGTSRRSTRTSTTWSSRCARSPRRRVGEPAAARARAPGRARTGCCSARRGSSA